MKQFAKVREGQVLRPAGVFVVLDSCWLHVHQGKYLNWVTEVMRIANVEQATAINTGSRGDVCHRIVIYFRIFLPEKPFLNIVSGHASCGEPNGTTIFREPGSPAAIVLADYQIMLAQIFKLTP